MSPTSLATLMVLAATAEATACLFLIHRERTRRGLAERASAENCARLVEMQELARIGAWEFDLAHDQIRWSPERCGSSRIGRADPAESGVAHL